jgi:hypothetical protein
MYVDTNLEFSDSQAVTSTAISANVYDTQSIAAGAGSTGLANNTTVDLGQAADDLLLVVQTSVACTDTSSDATLTITLESDSTANLATAPTVHFSTGAIAFASFATAGTRLVAVKLPHGAYKRYLGLRYTVASGPLTAGAFDAFLTMDSAGVYRPYLTNFVVI